MHTRTQNQLHELVLTATRLQKPLQTIEVEQESRKHKIKRIQMCPRQYMQSTTTVKARNKALGGMLANTTKFKNTYNETYCTRAYNGGRYFGWALFGAFTVLMYNRGLYKGLVVLSNSLHGSQRIDILYY